MKTMKLTNKFAATAFAALALVFATSCSEEDGGDDNGGGTTTDPVEDTKLTGTLKESRTLDASKEYTVTGEYLIAEGATLTIPAGTTIVSEKGSKTDQKYIAVLMGGKIEVKGESGKPVIMKGQGGSGDWGGLILCGKGKTTKGANSTAEVGGLKYGGDDNSDSSGSISYLEIYDAGAQINDESQFNGLTLYACGTGTSINNVSIKKGEDDGVEFFGGAANATDVTLEDNADDALDWTEGWNGTITNTSVSFSAGFKFSTAIEGDGSGTIEYPKVTNFKAVAADTDAGVGIELKNDSNATMTKVTLTNFKPQFSFGKKDAAGELIVPTDAELASRTNTAGDANAVEVNGAAASQAGTYAGSDL